MSITSHVLDIAAGRPARDIPVALDVHRGASGWVRLAERKTDADGRARDLLPPEVPLEGGHYRLTFDTVEYFRTHGELPFFPEIQVTFEVRDPTQHYHVPLLLSRYGYSTYRGS
jgi:5-hydroxyisourate hydrolase